MTEPKSTYQWLSDIGAKRPMTAAGAECIVLGEYCDGFYPITWYAGKKVREWCEDASCWGVRYERDGWYLFGIHCDQDLKREDVERIMRQLK